MVSGETPFLARMLQIRGIANMQKETKNLQRWNVLRHVKHVIACVQNADAYVLKNALTI